jgi:hypothetical protein
MECVYLQNPQAGLYLVEVAAASITQDAKVETPQVDADFALVMHPMGGGYRTSGGVTLDAQSNAPGDLTFAASGVPAAGWTEGFTVLSFDVDRAPGFGGFVGVEADSVTIALWGSAAAPGNAFHFPNTAGSYPFTNFTFPLPGLISLFAGLQVDAAVILFDGNDVAFVSNIDRVTLQ